MGVVDATAPHPRHSVVTKSSQTLDTKCSPMNFSGDLHCAGTRRDELRRRNGLHPGRSMDNKASGILTGHSEFVVCVVDAEAFIPNTQ